MAAHPKKSARKINVAVAGLGFIWIAFDAGNQAWHDKIAGTVVVRMPKNAPLV